MASTRDTAAGIESQGPEGALPLGILGIPKAWWLFCVFVFAVKLLLLWLDPTPKLFMGDSGAYIQTALKGWIPEDRSYFYGYLVRWLAVWPHSFTPLLMSQALASGVTTIVFTLICRRFFELSLTLAFLFGFICALDPLQLVWERYVMTETFSLLVYALVLYWSLAYLRDRRLWQVAVVQGFSVLLIGFRMSYLLLVQACTILLPVIAVARCFFPVLRKRLEPRILQANLFAIGVTHLIVSLALMFVMHGAYKYANGRLSHREPDYLYSTGDHLAAVWAPALEPWDATDPRFAEIVRNGDQFNMRSLHARNAQQYAQGSLIKRWREIETDRRKNERVTRETAMNALRRRPLVIVGLAVQTYMEYWNLRLIWKYARSDLGYGTLKDEQITMLAEKFGFRPAKNLRMQPLSLLQRYFLAVWPYYFVVVVSPLICAIATWLSRDRAFGLLLFFHASILLVVVTALSPQAGIRYIQPISLLTLLGLAACADWVARRAQNWRRTRLPDPLVARNAGARPG